MYHMYIKGFVNGRFQWSSLLFFYFQAFYPNTQSFPSRDEPKERAFTRTTEFLNWGKVYPTLVFATLAILFYPWHPACLRHPASHPYHIPAILTTLAILVRISTSSYLRYPCDTGHLLAMPRCKNL